MADSYLNSDLDEAELAMRQGDWEKALNFLTDAVEIEPTHVEALTGLGTCLLRLGRADEAIMYFERVAAVAPDSAIAFNNVGVAYGASHQTEKAVEAYKNALTLDPENTQAWKNLAILYLRDERVGEGVQILAAVVKTNPEDVEALCLLANCYEEGKQLESARFLFEEALKHQPENDMAREGIRRLDAIKSQERVEPSRIARPEHIAKLAGLKTLKGLKKNGAQPSSAVAQKSETQAALPVAKTPVVFYGASDAAVELRLGPVVEALSGDGYPIKVTSKPDLVDLDQFDHFVFSWPHATTELLQALGECIKRGKHVTVDLDLDFQHIPDEYPGYTQVGPGNSAGLRALESMLDKVNVITTPTQTLAAYYQKYNDHIQALPYGWNKSNALWDKPANSREMVQIGCVGFYTTLRDASILKNSLTRLFKENPQALLVIGADLRLYQAFSAVPEEQKLFIPLSSLEELPYLLSNFDILLFPQQETAFHRMLTDLPLMHAGARRIPWLAPAIPAYQEWAAGGMIVEKTGDWYQMLRKLVKDASLRRELGEAGRQMAEQREMHSLIQSWKSALQIA